MQHCYALCAHNGGALFHFILINFIEIWEKNFLEICLKISKSFSQKKIHFYLIFLIFVEGVDSFANNYQLPDLVSSIWMVKFVYAGQSDWFSDNGLNSKFLATRLVLTFHLPDLSRLWVPTVLWIWTQEISLQRQ